MTLPLRAHGAARVAASLGERAGWPPELSDVAREHLARADIAPEEQHLAWELARLAPGVGDREALQGLALLLADALGRGSTRLALPSIRERAREVLGDETIGARIEALLATPPAGAEAILGEGRALVVEGDHLYAERVLAVERALAERVAARAAAGDVAVPVEALESVFARPAKGPRGPIELTDEQRRAVEVALGAPISMVSGGPGTGKTSIVVAMLRVAARLGFEPESIALAAPTGKAADRMRASIGAALASLGDPDAPDERLRALLPAPRTLHRLLGFSPSSGRFRHHGESPLSARLVVLDEGSMIDVFLMERVISALRPEAQLVVLGDADQLPSVAAGAVFRDLSGAVPSVRLTKSHRLDPRQPEGSHILRVAGAINEGRLPALEGPGAFLRPAGPAEREAFLASWAARASLGDGARRTFVRDGDGWDAPALLAELFAKAERHRLLCITRRGRHATSVDTVNAWLHREAARGPGERWVAGEPVLVSRNDYERGLFNGDQGVLLWVAGGLGEPPRLCAVFRRDASFAAHPLEAVRAGLELGWATTVHKAQGSEHDEVALLLPEVDHPRLATREIVYTAITRARRRVEIVGARGILARAVARKIERSSGIAERLAALR